MRMISGITAATAVIAATMAISARAETPAKLLGTSALQGRLQLVADSDWSGAVGHALRGDIGGAVQHAAGDYGRGGWGGGGWDGHGRRGHGYGWDGYGAWGRSGYGYSPYRSGYGYGYSRPYYGYNYGYSTPSYGYRYSQPGYSYDSGHSTGYWPNAAANPAATTEPIRSRVVNPADNQATLRYSVNGRQYSIRPGEQHDFTEPGPGVIEFDRGNNAGLVQYRLSGGVYTFAPTDRGWELFRSQGDLATAH